jgi:hypothetical protein
VLPAVWRETRLVKKVVYQLLVGLTLQILKHSRQLGLYFLSLVSGETSAVRA